ncbi:CatB-related O-acetyltransferase [Chryseobacterium chendengshani]|uniref:CatB-related O-acetyltransferase n=1 Tax=Chryseobacterium sp. LJ668 TaxID=2864040 RepID=UPI001C687B41|nr:CatB-related O-acetyltransferase [Chryseobacterium sp. LJ668]MBW8521817.1 CatB-related O-acetyltransferase [Chryseobacterium sp. LJ668]QYK17478.1 CatB-related O-acetyltransferase [Chryseobacterium sp. LJ668]
MIKSFLKKIKLILKKKLVGKQNLDDLFPDKKDLFPNVQIMATTLLSGQNEIGEYTYVGFHGVITSSKIGRYCSIANNVSIGIGEHKIQRVSTNSIFYKDPFKTLTEKECTIGNDVWIGSNVIIRRGVTVGNGAIIGSNSFVNKDVKPFEIVGGSPARFIRMRFSDEQINLINNSNWWDESLSLAKQKIEQLEQTGLFEKN